MKKIISAILAAAVCLSLASCGDVTPEETTTGTAETTTAETTTAETTTLGCTTTEESTTASETEESTSAVENPPATEVLEVADIERIAVGEYMTLVYNGASAEVDRRAKGHRLPRKCDAHRQDEKRLSL